MQKVKYELKSFSPAKLLLIAFVEGAAVMATEL